MSTDSSPLWELLREKESVKVPVQGRFLMNSMGMIKKFTVMNMGIGLLSAGLVREEVSEGVLVKVLPEWQASAVSVYAVSETRLLPAKTQRFIDFLREKLSN